MCSRSIDSICGRLNVMFNFCYLQRRNLLTLRGFNFGKLSARLVVYRSQITRIPFLSISTIGNESLVPLACAVAFFFEIPASSIMPAERMYRIVSNASRIRVPALPRSYEVHHVYVHTYTHLYRLGNATLQRVLSTAERKIEVLADDGVSRSTLALGEKSWTKKSPVAAFCAGGSGTRREVRGGGDQCRGRPVQLWRGRSSVSP